MAELTWYISANPILNNGSGNSGGVVNQTTPNQESTSRSQNEGLTRSTAQILAVTTAKKSVSYLASNVGKYSGNQRDQILVNNVSKVIGYGVAFAVNPALGAATMAFDAVITGIDNWWEQKWDKARTQQAKARAGEGVGYRQ